MENVNYGMSVRLVRMFGENRIVEETLHNVTEIHYMHDQNTPSVAFESDIHGTGMNCQLSTVIEFETRPETEKQADF